MSQSQESLLNLYHCLIELRRGNPLLTHGAIKAVGVEGNVLRYERRHGNDRLAIALNMGHKPAQVSLPRVECCSQPISIVPERMWTEACRFAQTKESLFK
jgi:alpha-glucosidase